MKITFVENKYKMGNRFKDIMTEKLSRLDKYFGEEATARVVGSAQGKQEKLEVTISNKGVLYRGEVSSLNNYDNIDLVLPKIERQIVRNKQKLTKGKRTAPKSLGLEFLEEVPETKLAEVFKKKSFTLEPTMLEEAKDAIERLDHTFYIFLNAETGKVNVLYKRNDGKYGLIEVNF